METSLTMNGKIIPGTDVYDCTGKMRWRKSYAYFPFKFKNKWFWLEPIYIQELEKIGVDYDDMSGYSYWKITNVTDNRTSYILYGENNEKTIR